MATHALMEKPGQGQMYVPAEKLPAFLDDGWVIVRPAEQTEVGPYAPAVSTETIPAANEAAAEAPDPPKVKKSKKG